ncbi:hypothetical protein BHE74_00033256 [Ensete ventricosum]|nr:hypothetical protein BHE74_00033256 [Ensete ventricosum]
MRDPSHPNPEKGRPKPKYCGASRLRGMSTSLGVLATHSASHSRDVVHTAPEPNVISSDLTDSVKEHIPQVNQRLDEVQRKFIKSKEELSESSKGLPIELSWRKSTAEAHSPSGKLELGRSTVEPWNQQAPLDSCLRVTLVLQSLDLLTKPIHFVARSGSDPTSVMHPVNQSHLDNIGFARHGSSQRVSKVKNEKNEAKTKKRLTRTMGLAARSIRTSNNRVYRSVAKLRSCVSWTYFAKASPSSHTQVL